MRRYASILSIAGALLASPAVTAHAAQSVAVRVPASLRAWTLAAPDDSETKLDQVYLPVIATVRLSAAWDVVLSSAMSGSSLELENLPASKLNGASDVTAQALFRPAGDRILLQAGVNLPTGKKELDDEELAVAQILAHPVLGFPVKQLGRGFDVSAGAALAGPLGGGLSGGMGVGVVIPGAYALLAGQEDFTPGTEIAVSGGLDLGADGSEAGSGILRLDATYRYFGKDKIGDTEIFEEGAQIELQALGRTSMGELGLSALARSVLKSDNTVLAPAGDDVGDITEAAGASVFGQLGADYPFGEAVRAGVQGEFRLYDGSEGARADGSAIGAGPYVMLGLADRGWLRAGAMLLSGSLEGGDAGDTDLSGFAVNVGFFWRGSFETR